MAEEEKDEEEECEPCKLGAVLGITRFVCDQQGKEKASKCEELYQKAVMGEIKLKEFVGEVKKLVSDPLDIKTLNSVEEVLKDFGYE
jgi:hypothetical protein